MKTAVISPFLKIKENLPLLIINLSQIYAEKISAFSFKILTGLSAICVAFLDFNLSISLKTSLTLTPQRQAPGPFFFVFNGNITWIVFIFKYRFENRMRNISCWRLESPNSEILGFFTALEKKRIYKFCVAFVLTYYFVIFY